MSKLAARLQDIEAVTYAVLMDKEGNPVQDNSIEAVALAAKGFSWQPPATASAI